ncbi:MAG: LytR C-terminal domain-containing protein [Jatrophihabitans sp.]|uniref:LytR C-terminal domain-containing protein n=1 Tax=Jatrophihabitans sp. TaxID=1932789 RepID=UPI003F8109DF
MPSTTRRRPLPALVFLVALLGVTALVWWRVIGRNTGSSASGPCPTPRPSTSSSSSSAAPAGTTLPTPQSVTVAVLNATNRSGIAKKARDVLMSDGFSSPSPAADDKSGVHVTGVAEIRYGPGQQAAAKLLQYYLPSAALVPTTATDRVIVVSLGERYRRIAPAADVTAALKADGVTLSDAPAPTPTPAPSGSASTSPRC